MSLDTHAEAERLSLISQTLRSEGDVSARPGQMASLHALADRIDLIAGRLAATQPRTVTTAEELDALPLGSVVLDSTERAWQRDPFSWIAVTPLRLHALRPLNEFLPATVLYVPDEEGR